MKNYQEFLTDRTYIKTVQLSEMDICLHTLAFISTIDETLTESTELFEVDVKKYLNKIGLDIHKGKGIIEYIKDFLVGTGKIFYYIMTGEKEKAKELLKTVKKSDILDFLYKLDLATLHIFTGPIHFIDAVTGYDLKVKMQDKIEQGKNIITDVLIAIKKVKEQIIIVFNGKNQKRAMKTLDNLEQSLLPS